MTPETDNFDTCQFRSADKEERVIVLCCGKREQKEGYSCTLLSIFDIDRNLCKECKFYTPIDQSLKYERKD